MNIHISKLCPKNNKSKSNSFSWNFTMYLRPNSSKTDITMTNWLQILII